MSFSKRLLSGAAPALVPGENFKVVQYTGNGSSQSITGVGFQPDFVWHKRLNSSSDHNLSDSTRGVKKGLNINDPRAEGDQDPLGVTSFDSDGFTVNDNSGGGAGVNGSGDTYVAWCWKGGGGATSNSDGNITSTVNANKAAGFSIVKYTGTGSSGTVGHGLSSDPKLIVNKRIASSADWLAGAVTWTKYLEPNGTPPFRTANVWTDTQPTSTTFGVINSTSASSVEYINYCWADVEGYQKISTYEGNGSTNGPVVNVGFEPAYVMVKNLDSTDNWLVFDNARNTTNPRTNLIQWNLGAAQSTESGAQMNFYSNGFQSVGTGGGGGSGQINANGDTYLYLAIAATAAETPALASSFNIETYTGTGNDPLVINGLGFSPGFVWIKVIDAAREHILSDIVRGPNKELSTNATDAEESRGVKSFDSDGFTLDDSTSNYNHNGENYVAWTWKAGDFEPTINTNGSLTSFVSANDNAGFSIVSYTGDGNSARTVGHGLSAKCDLVIIKSRDSADKWPAQLPQLGDNARMVLEATAGKTDDSTTAQAGNATVFGIGGDNSVNKSGDRFIAYCFRNVTGYQKIGSYTGDGQTDQTITTGFKPDFIVIKSTVGNANWRVYDTKRTIDGGFIRIHTTGAPHTDSDTPNIEIISTGFKITSGGVNNGVNANGNLYFYWAIAKNVPSNNTLANSFRAVTYTGNQSANSITGVGFRPDLVWIKERSGTDRHVWIDSLRGLDSQLSSNDNAAQTTYQSNFDGFDSDGFTLGDATETNGNGETYVAWCWKAGNQWQSNVDGTQASLVNANTANGFSIVKYVGTGSSGSVGHGLSSTPDFVTIKRLDGSTNWQTWYTGAGTNPSSGINRLYLNTSDDNDSSTTNVYYPDATKINLNSGDHFFNTSGANYIAYCWHSVSGYSKIATYTGNGGTLGVTGVGFQPDFVLIKETDGVDSWQIYDSPRGAGKVLYPNGNNAEYAGSELSSFDSDGFTVTGNPNESGKTYLYYAVRHILQPQAGFMSFLVVAGGGSGGRGSARSGGGGGAGGLRTSYGLSSGGGASAESDITLAAGTYTITVGAGGAAKSGSDGTGNDGGDSSIAASGLTTITSTGGGGGGYPGSGRDGGSGGGGAHGGGSAGAGTANQGFAGGTGVGESTYNGGGGGGASAAGSNSSTSNGGAGGAGLTVDITGSSVAYAGGGGGGGGGTAGSGGTGGGGAGGTTTGTSATANTGGGGGGAQSTSGAGGSGVVVLRLLTSEYSGTTTGSPTVTTTGDYTIIKYTSSGTYVHS